jgi:hypothetical protein
MQAYLQDSEGGETELRVTEPDPADGTYVVHIHPELHDDGTLWIRVIPETRTALKWVCKTSRAAIQGEPYFIPGRASDTWEIDMSDCYCPIHTDDSEACEDWEEV